MSESMCRSQRRRMDSLPLSIGSGNTTVVRDPTPGNRITQPGDTNWMLESTIGKFREH